MRFVKHRSGLLFAVIAASFWIVVRNIGHWPGSFSGFASFLERAAAPVFGMAAWLVVMAGLGRFAFTRCLRSDISGGLRFGICAAGGLGVWGTLVQILGLSGFIHLGSLALCAAIAVIMAWRHRRSLEKDIRQAAPSLLPISWSEGLCAALALGQLWHSLAFALCPPTDVDALVYHMSVPKLYLQTGEIFFIPWLVQASFPFLTEMHNLTGLSAGVESWGALTQAACVVLIGVVIVERFNSLVGRPVGWLAAALLFSMPVVMPLSASARGDASLALFSVGAFLLGCHAKNRQHTGSAFLAGIFAGFACGTKYIGVIQAAWLILFLAPRWALMSRSLLGVGLAGALWYVRNILWTGNPVYPFAYSFLGGPFWNKEIGEALLRMATWDKLGFSWLHFFAQPLYWIFYPAPYLDQPPYLAIPLVLLFPAVFVFMKNWNPAAKRMLVYGGLHYIFLFPHGSVWRFMLSVWPWLCGLLAGAASSLFATRWRPLSLVLIVGFWPALRNTEGSSLDYLTSPKPTPQARRDYLLKNLDQYPAMEWANQNLPRGSRLLFFRDTRMFYADVNAIAADPLTQGWLPLLPAPSAPSLSLMLKERGITHIYIRESPLTTPHSRLLHPPASLASMDAVLRQRGRLLFRQGVMAIYEIQ